jgi:hypothetical protein
VSLNRVEYVLFAFFAFCTTLLAQVITGQITGRVVDPSGAVVVNASVVVRNTQTGVGQKATTTESGYYTAPNLQPGLYSVTVSMEGFRTETRAGFEVRVDQTVRLDFTLQLGSTAETIQVSGTTSAVETESGSLGTTMEQRKIIDLPLNARNTFRLTLLVPGVTEGQSYGDSFNGASRFSVNGSRPMSAEVTIDGISNATPGAIAGRTFIAIFPPPDALQEFKLETNSNSAEFGRTGGGVVNMVLRSGTNRFHGALYEYLRNSAMDANTFFSNANGVALGSFKRHQFGANLGGPIVPNRAFFFISYEGQQRLTQSVRNDTVPALKQRLGDFSQTGQLVSGACAPVTIYDPATTQTNPSGVGFVRQPFPGNQIPPSQLDPVGAKMMSYYPLPTGSGAACSNVSNHFAAGTDKFSSNQIDAKVDLAPNERDRGFIGVSWVGNLHNSPDLYGTIADPNGSYLLNEQLPARAARIDYTRIQTPRLVMDVRAGVVRWERTNPPYPENFRLSDLGFPASLQNSMRPPFSFPAASVTGYSGLGNTTAFTYQAGTSYSFWSAAAWTRNAHTLKFGGDFRIFQSYEYSGFNTSGAFSFDRSFTQGPDPNVAGATRGNAIASMLVGLGSGSIQVLPPILTSSKYFALFVQDQWKVTPKLTLEAGLRWDGETPRHERHNQLSFWDFNTPSPLAALVPSLPNLRGGLRFVGVDAPAQFRTYWHNFGPRISVAYAPAANLAVRAGYGLFYPAFVGSAIGGAAGMNGFQSTSSWVSSLNGVTPANYLSNAFPQGLSLPTGSALGLLANVGLSITANRDGAQDPNNRPSYVQQWNLSLQRQVGPGILLEAAYVGSKGTRIYDPAGWDLNQLPVANASVGAALQQLVPNPFFGVIKSGQLAQATIARGQLLRPYPQFLGVMDWWPTSVSSIYHGFQFRAQEQLRGGLTFLGGATFGKVIDDQGPHQDGYNRRADRSIAPDDQSYHITASVVYELPVGRGKRIGGAFPGWLNQVLGNWQLNGVATFASGYPLSLATANTAGLFTQLVRPNAIGNPQLSSGRPRAERIAKWFNTSAFQQPAPFTLGSASRTLPNVRSDGTKNVDISIFKSFRWRERGRVELRGESFNLFNRTQFSAPGVNLGTATFGVVSSQYNNPRQTQIALKVLF